MCPFCVTRVTLFCTSAVVTYFERKFVGYHQWKALTVGYICMKEESNSRPFVKTAALETGKDAKNGNASNAGNVQMEICQTQA